MTPKLKIEQTNNIIYSTSCLTDEYGNSNIEHNIKLGLIKVCVEPGCESIFHNCDVKIKRCEFCSSPIKMINQETFFKKFSNRFFQYDQASGEYFRPKKIVLQYQLF